MRNRVLLFCSVCFLLFSPFANAGDATAPQWMHALVNAPLPAHDDKTDAVLLYSETNVTVLSTEKIKTVERRGYKILRPGGRDVGIAIAPLRHIPRFQVFMDGRSRHREKITRLRKKMALKWPFPTSMEVNSSAMFA